MNAWTSLPDHARIWFYGAKRPLTADEVAEISRKLDAFCADWAAHGAKLSCGYSILNNQLILLGVDEAIASASGCSIDTSVRLFQELDAEYQLDLFNRLRIFVKDGEQIRSLMAQEIKSELEQGYLHGDSLVIDALVHTKEAVETNLIKPLNQTWLARYLS